MSVPSVGKNAQEKSCSTSSKSVTQAIVLDAGPDIPIIDADEFIKDFLPRVPGTDAVVGRIVSWIENCPKYYARRRWKKFAQDPDKYKQREPAVFARLSDVSNAVIEAVAEIMPELEATRTTTYVEKPTKPPETVFRQDLSRPDAYFLFRERFSADEKNPHWMDIAVAGEFKKKNNSETVESDITQVLWDMHEMMREDPRRRRCFGFTIENRDFRMYSTTRSEIVVSRVVDFLSSPRHIIKFFFALMYSSEEALGRDMSMTPIWNGNSHITPQYDIRVHTQESELAPVVVKTFRTVKLLSGIGAETIRGRGTRVWEVYKVEDGKVDDSHTYVLKDGWVDSDRMPEAKVVAAIVADAEQLEDEEEKQALLGCLLTTSEAGNVLLSDGTVDCTLSGRKRGRHIVNNNEKFNLTPYSAPPGLKSTSPPVPSPTKNNTRRAGHRRSPGDHHDAADDATPGEQKALVYDAKTHYRIVFEEVCTVLHALTSLHDIVYTLWSACHALEVLHKLGWVHRDISSGNIMLCGNNAKITDFEYAKKMTLPGKKVHEIRTGTEDFMAVEVRAQEFLFLPQKSEKSFRDGIVRPTAIHIPVKPATKIPVLNDQTGAQFTWFYNPLHDMESIFWLMLYFITNKDIVLGAPIERMDCFDFAAETEDDRRRRILAHWNFGLTLFSSRQGRERVIGSQGVLSKHLLTNPLHPAITPLADILCRLRNALTNHYFTIERNPPSIHHNSGQEVHDAYAALLQDAVAHLQIVPFEVEVRSLRGAVEALPKSCQQERVDQTSKSVISTGSKRVREDGDAGREPKSQRVSLDQKSPSRTTSPDASPRDEAPAAAATEATPGVPLPTTRVLRSHSRKAAAKTFPPSPRPAARACKAMTPKPRKGKATKNHEAVKAAAKVAATKVKNKTRKGR